MYQVATAAVSTCNYASFSRSVVFFNVVVAHDI